MRRPPSIQAATASARNRTCQPNIVNTGPGPTQEAAQKYLEKFYGQLGLRICWATAREFCGELKRRWRAFADD